MTALKHFLKWVALISLTLLIVACTASAQRVPAQQLVAGADDTQANSTGTAPTAPSPVASATPTAIPTPTATATAAPTATPTQTPTQIPTAAQSATPTATPTPLHPLSIEGMRQGVYPGSEILIEAVLDPGANYDRYVASYLSDGLRINALLTVPRGDRPAEGWPVIVFNHGYIPPEVYRTTERYVAYVDGFARNGYIVFKPDYRGHGSSEGEALSAYGRPDYTIDVLNAVAAIRRLPDADPGRVGMWGHSMGGYITLRSMVVGDEIKAGVIWAGVLASYPDLISRWRRAPEGQPTPTPNPRWGGWRQAIMETYGSPEENPEFWASISANSYLADLSGPVQLHHGTADESVPLEFSETLVDQVAEAGGVVEFYAYDGDDHNLATYFGLAMQRSIAFFDLHVKGALP